MTEKISDNVWKGCVGDKEVIAKTVALDVSHYENFMESMEKLNGDVIHNQKLCHFDSPMVLNGQVFVVRPWKGRTLREEIIKGKGLRLENIIRCPFCLFFLMHIMSYNCLFYLKYDLFFCRYGLDIIRAIEELHLVNRVSSSLKPENILLEQNEALVADFCLPSILRSFEKQIHVDIPHTYSAPETWINRNESLPPSEASDCWSFGCMLLEMCSGYFM